MIDRLPEDAQTLFAEALALLLAEERGRGWGPAVTNKVRRGLRSAVKRWSDAALGAEIVEPLLET